MLKNHNDGHNSTGWTSNRREQGVLPTIDNSSCEELSLANYLIRCCSAMADQHALGWVFLTCLVLALMSSLSTVGASRRLLQLMPHSEKVPETQVTRAELMHRDHPNSPLSPLEGTTSMADRLAASARRDKARMARRLGEADFSTVMNASGDGEFTTTLYFGTPPQKFTMIVDTGSDLVWLQCLPCSSPSNTCFPEPDPYFNTSASFTYSTVPFNDSYQCDPSVFGPTAPTDDTDGNCHISYSYVDHSAVSGTLSTDTVAVSNSSVGFPNFLFGCMNNNTVDFGAVDGLAGFGRGFISLPRQLSDSSSFDVFSYCLLPFTASATATSPLFFGIQQVPSTGLPVSSTPMLTYDLTSYFANMTGISINGIDVGIPSTAFEYNTTNGDSGVIFDSGTTLLTFKRNIYTIVEEALKGLITYPTVSNQDFDLCFNASGVQNPTYPSMSLQFAAADGTTADYLLATENIFIPFSDTVDCVGISALDGINSNFIGNIAQGNHYMIYDVVDAKIGWVSYDCTSPL